MTVARRLLVLEDDPVLREVLLSLLEDEGYDVRQASDGATGIALLNDWHPDAILLDLMMPMMDGASFLEHKPVSELPPVILLSAVRDLSEQAERLGAAGYVRKPFDLDVLLNAVRDVIER
jgi:two-component system response regulator MprA